MSPPKPRLSPSSSPPSSFSALCCTHKTRFFFFIFVLMLRTHTHIYILYISLTVSLYFCSLHPRGWSAEQRGREAGPGAARVVSDSHKCVKEEKRKSYGLSSASAAQVSSYKGPLWQMSEWSAPVKTVQYLFVCEEGWCVFVSVRWQRRWEEFYTSAIHDSVKGRLVGWLVNPLHHWENTQCPCYSG